MIKNNCPKFIILMIQIPLHTDRKLSVLEILQYLVLISVVLYFGKTLFIPLSFSMLISFILYPVCKWMEKKGMKQSVAIFVSLSSVMIFVGAIVYLLFTQIVEFSTEWQPFKAKLIETVNQLSVFLAERFDVSTEKQLGFLKTSACKHRLDRQFANRFSISNRYYIFSLFIAKIKICPAGFK